MDNKSFQKAEIIHADNGYILKLSTNNTEIDSLYFTGVFVFKTMEELCDKLKELDVK